MVSVWAIATWRPTAVGLALGVGVYLAITVLVIMAWSLHRYSVSTVELLLTVAPPWGLGVLVFCILRIVSPQPTTGLPALIIIVAQTLAFTFLITVGARFAIPRTMRDCLSVLPERFEVSALRLLHLGPRSRKDLPT